MGQITDHFKSTKLGFGAELKLSNIKVAQINDQCFQKIDDD